MILTEPAAEPTDVAPRGVRRRSRHHEDRFYSNTGTNPVDALAQVESAENLQRLADETRRENLPDVSLIPACEARFAARRRASEPSGV